MCICRDGRSKATRDRSVSPAPFVSKTQATGKMTQSAKSPATHNRSKVHKPPAKSGTKKAAESGGQGNMATGGSATTGIASKMPSHTGNNSSKVKKSQKRQMKIPNADVSVHPDVQSSSYLTLPAAQSKTAGASTLPGSVTNELNPFNQNTNQPTDPAQLKHILDDSSASSSGSSSSSSSGSSDSESETESPHMQTGFTSGGSNLGGGVAPVVSSGMNMPSLQQPPQPPARGSFLQLWYTVTYTDRNCVRPTFPLLQFQPV